MIMQKKTHLQNVFVKKYVPKDMIAPKESIYHLSLKSQKRDIT